jgi:hypothetical protein
MWACLDNYNKVTMVIHPDCPPDTLNNYAQTYTLIEMTVENSPAWVNGYYKDGKFYPPKGMTDNA